MALKDDQTVGADEVLLGRFVTAVKAVASAYVSESIDVPGHAGRMALAKSVFKDKGANNYGRMILEIAIAQNAKLILAGADVADQDIIDCVTQYMETFATEGW